MREDERTVRFAALPTIIPAAAASPAPGGSAPGCSVDLGCKANLHASPITPFKIFVQTLHPLIEQPQIIYLQKIAKRFVD